jgi:hypothetical protein
MHRKRPQSHMKTLIIIWLLFVVTVGIIVVLNLQSCYTPHINDITDMDAYWKVNAPGYWDCLHASPTPCIDGVKP